MSLLELRRLTRRFATTVALDALDLAVTEGEFLTVLGASGSGKTTTLRLVAGFDSPTSGEIVMDGAEITALPPNRRDINTVFQQYALFPHLSVRENVGFGLRMRRVAAAERLRRVTEALEMVQLAALEARRPHELSGGQQQRVALARALVNRPRLLLLDEPLGALDLRLRRDMQLELTALNRRLGITFVYVTHDQEEALTMSDRIALMRAGRIEQLGTPRELYDHPQTRYVAGFIGETNLLAGEAASAGGDDLVLRIAGTAVRVPRPAAAPRDGTRAWLSLRPEAMTLAPADAAVPGNALRATVTSVVYAGQFTRVHCALPDGTPLLLHVPPSATAVVPGTPVLAAWPVEAGICVVD